MICKIDIKLYEKSEDEYKEIINLTEKVDGINGLKSILTAILNKAKKIYEKHESIKHNVKVTTVVDNNL